MEYTTKDIISKKGHIMTSDEKYYLSSDGDFDYWCKIRSRTGDSLKLQPPIGRYSYDYVFRCNIPACVVKLNALLKGK